jgi:hypothetical protein
VPAQTVIALTGAAAVCGAAAAVIAGISTSRNPVAAATILAGDLAAVALAVTLLLALGAWWQRGPRSAPARRRYLRQAGVMYQFRHAARQDRLASPAAVNGH